MLTRVGLSECLAYRSGGPGSSPRSHCRPASAPRCDDGARHESMGSSRAKLALDGATARPVLLVTHNLAS